MRSTQNNRYPDLRRGSWERYRRTVGTALMVVGTLGGVTGAAYTFWTQPAREAAYRSSLEYQATKYQLDQQFSELTAGLAELGYESDAPETLRHVTKEILAETIGESAETISDEHRAMAERLIDQMAALREHPEAADWLRPRLKRYEGRLRQALAAADGSRLPVIMQGRGLRDGSVQFMLFILIGSGIAVTGFAVRSGQWLG